MPVKSTLDSWRKSYKEFEKPDKRSHTYTHYTWIALNSSTHLAQTNPFPPFSQHQTDKVSQQLSSTGVHYENAFLFTGRTTNSDFSGKYHPNFEKK